MTTKKYLELIDNLIEALITGNNPEIIEKIKRKIADAEKQIFAKAKKEGE